MKKAKFKVLSLVLVLILLLTACGDGNKGNGDGDKTEAIKDLVVTQLASNEMETFNVFYSQSAVSLDVLTNMIDPLLEHDKYGKLVPALAKSWKMEDEGKTWVFEVRDGVKWVDMNGKEKADLVADDFASGLEWVLNFHKNDSYNVSMPSEMIEGAEEYFEWTKELDAEEAKALTADADSKFREMVGLEVDGNVLTYKLLAPKPYFDTLATYNPLYPLSQKMVEELGGADKAKDMNNENMWYCGAYTMTTYVHGNEKVFTKNPLYWDKDAKIFDTVTVKMVDSHDVAYQLYESGEIDKVSLTEAQVNIIKNDENHKFHDYLVSDQLEKYSFHILFNYDKKDKDGNPDENWNKAIANTAFRQAWFYGLDLEDYFKRFNAISPYNLENNYYSMKGLAFTSDGTDYVDLVREELGLAKMDGKKMVRLDADKTAALKKQAMEELTALGVTFPVEADYYVAGGDQNQIDTATVLKDIISKGLGDDFVKLNIKTYISSVRKEVADLKLHGIHISGWGADYGDPQNFLAQELYKKTNAYFTDYYSNANDIADDAAHKDLIAAYKEFTDLAVAADAITDDLDARYKAYAKAEAVLIDKALVIPTHYRQYVALSKVDITSMMNGVYGMQNPKYKNWETNAKGYTTEEMKALEDKYEAGKN